MIEYLYKFIYTNFIESIDGADNGIDSYDKD